MLEIFWNYFGIKLLFIEYGTLLICEIQPPLLMVMLNYI